ncbi:hypothetical protein [Chitinophaga sp. SYP-B3965]|uniref:hypothetical protein n=1 Tax=Chitinophaga sp. SYP-B3965 TaxID=2663120 RepID=UPI0012999201|nr:hypothetical protein [Chitinophaga sp. SYP-B3965]
MSVIETLHVKDTREAITPAPVDAWKSWHKVLFRIAFIFFVAICIPNSAEWYKLVLNIDWTHLHYRDLYDIARFGSGINFFGDTIFGSNLLGYANWITTAIIAIAGGFIWTAIVRWRKTEREEYNTLYYWLRVIVRYRAGIGIIGFGFTKLLPVQMPYPSLGILNTNFGDLTAQKIYWLSVGIVPWYQIFAGVVEITAGSLLLFRKTTTLGAILLFAALGDIVYVNFAYDGGVHVYSSYFVLLAAFLLINDLPKLYNLLILERYTVPVNFYPDLSARWKKYTRFTLKAATLAIFLGWFFYLQLINFLYDPYKQPSVAGEKELRGNFTVTEFRLNNQVIPYSPSDSLRWQEATFEDWTTFTFRVNRPVQLDLSNGGGDPQKDLNRTFEVAGVGGGQRVFHYYADPKNHVLYLQDKFKANPERRNRAAGVGGDGGTARNLKADSSTAATAALTENWIPKEVWQDEVNRIDERASSTRRDREFATAKNNEKRNRMILQYDTKDGNRVILRGINENKDSIYVVLDKVQRKYVLSESSLKAGKY